MDSLDEKTLRNLFDHSPLMMGIVELVGEDIRHIWDNDSSALFYGRPSPHELSQRLESELGIPRKQIRQWIKHYRISERGRIPVRFDHVHRAPEGERWYAVTLTFLGPQKSGQKQYSYVLSDITARKKYEDALRESEIRFRAAAEGSLDAFTILRSERDDSGKVTSFVFEDINHNAEKFLGLQREELIGKRLSEIPQVVAPLFAGHESIAQYIQVIESGKPFETEFSFTLGADGIRWVKQQVVPLVDGIAITSRDITSRKLSEQLIEEQQKTLLYSAKMSALGEMASGVAHEINNPLAIIHALSEQLRSYAESDELDSSRVANAARKIESTAKRIARIIRGLRTFSREINNEPLEQMPAGKILEDTLDFCQSRFSSHGVELRTSGGGPETAISCRPVQISQVLLNLLNNAFDAAMESSSKWISIEIQDSDAFVEFAVSDSGSGVPPEIRDKIMQPFFTTKEVGRGTGLGLSIAKGIIESHGGQLFLDTRAPHTRFVFRIPKNRPASRHSDHAA